MQFYTWFLFCAGILLNISIFTKGSSIKYVRKIYRKANISNSLIRTHTCEYYGVRNVSFLKNFKYVNGWPLRWGTTAQSSQSSGLRCIFSLSFLSQTLFILLARLRLILGSQNSKFLLQLAQDVIIRNANPGFWLLSFIRKHNPV